MLPGFAKGGSLMTTTQWTGKNYRITFLTERLVRLEYQSEGRFEDRPTTAVQCRDFPPVTVREQRLPGRVELDKIGRAHV